MVVQYLGQPLHTIASACIATTTTNSTQPCSHPSRASKTLAAAAATAEQVLAAAAIATISAHLLMTTKVNSKTSTLFTLTSILCVRANISVMPFYIIVIL
jgi:hypothetical protein